MVDLSSYVKVYQRLGMMFPNGYSTPIAWWLPIAMVIPFSAEVHRSGKHPETLVAIIVTWRN